MIRLAHWIFVPSVYARLQTRYLGYRRAGSSWLSATLACFWVAMAWIVMPLENPRFQAMRERHE